MLHHDVSRNPGRLQIPRASNSSSLSPCWSSISSISGKMSSFSDTWLYLGSKHRLRLWERRRQFWRRLWWFRLQMRLRHSYGLSSFDVSPSSSYLSLAVAINIVIIVFGPHFCIDRRIRQRDTIAALRYQSWKNSFSSSNGRSSYISKSP